MLQFIKSIFSNKKTNIPNEVRDSIVVPLPSEKKETINFDLGYKPKSETTIVYMPAVDFFDNYFGGNPQNLLKHLAKIGYNIVFINKADVYFQTEVIEHPYSELPNFLVVRYGTDARSFIAGRTIYWVNDSRFYTSIERLYPDLVIYDCSVTSEAFSRYSLEMEKVSDLVIVGPENAHAFGKYCKNIFVINENDDFKTAINIAKLIDTIPNRPAPLM